jgi:CO/xanthine dehydrogenase FAD-binding subunit
MDSEKTPYDQGAFSSRGTYYSGHATRMAASEVAERLKTAAARRLGNQPIRLEQGMARCSDQELPIGDLIAECAKASGGVLSVESSYVEPDVEMADRETGLGNLSGTYAFAAHAAEVEVDRKTGRIVILDYVAAHDIGTAINPTLVEGQIAGGVAMGLGAAIVEELIHERGRLVNPAYLHYALPRAADLPPIRTILIEGGDPKGPYGAKSVGEIGTTPPAPALANAVYDAVGVRVRDLPITPDKILMALAAKEGRRRDHRLWRRPRRWWIEIVRRAYPLGLFQLLRRWGPRLIHHPPSRPLEAFAMPSNLADLLAALGPAAMLVGGGTDVQLQRRQGLVAPTRLVSVLDVPEMKAIEIAVDGGIRIGAAVTLAELADEMSTRCPLVEEAVAGIASPQIRAMATVGGNLVQSKRCWFFRNDFDCYKRSGAASPCYAILGDHRFYHAAIDGHRCQAVTPSDLATAFVALDAEAIITGSAGTRSLAMGLFYTGPGETALLPGEVLAQIRIPAAAARRHGAFEKLRLWEGDFALASVAITADVDDDGFWRHPRIVLGAVAPTPWRARKTERRLDGARVRSADLRVALDQELNAAAHPLANNGWKLDAVAGLAEHAADRIGRKRMGHKAKRINAALEE